MAKYEKRLHGDFSSFVNWVDKDIMNGSVSASYENGSDISFDDVKTAVRVYERYSMLGSNRVSMNITFAGKGNDLFISAITSAGSQAVFFKINTFGEENFLNLCRKSVENFIKHQS